MTKILVNRVKKVNPQDRTQEKWYASIKSNASVDLRALTKKVSKNTTLAEGEVYLVITELRNTIAEVLLNGNTVKIEELGSLRLTARSKGTATKEECNASCITGVRVGFLAAQELKDKLAKAEFTLATKLVTE